MENKIKSFLTGWLIAGTFNYFIGKTAKVIWPEFGEEFIALLSIVVWVVAYRRLIRTWFV